jgi:hypothetical protein
MKTIIILAALLTISGSSMAQQEATLRLHDGRNIKGMINHISSDSVYFSQPQIAHYAERAENLPSLVFSREQISAVVVSGGSGVLPYTLLGMGIGALSSTVFLLVTNPGDGSMEDLNRFIGAVFITGSIVVGGIGGLIYGLIAGRSDTTFDMSRDSDFDVLRNTYGNAAISRR